MTCKTEQRAIKAVSTNTQLNRATWISVVCALLAGCSSNVHVDLTRGENASDSHEYCGVKRDGANLHLGQPENLFDLEVNGLTIRDHGPLDPLFRGSVCVSGELSWFGCGVGDVVCTDAIYPVAIAVQEYRILEEE